MIGPADGWEHVEMTLRGESVWFQVVPVRFVQSMGTAYSTPVHETKANGFEVAMRDGAAEEARWSLATFADVQDAWEFAAIATHYVDARSPDRLAAKLDDGTTGAVQPSGLVSDRTPLSVFADLAGHDTEPIAQFLD